MKKLFAILLLSVILCLSFSAVLPAVSAADDDWTLGPYAEYLTHNGKKYYPVNTERSFNYSDDVISEKLLFEDSATEGKYRDSYLWRISEDIDYAVEVELCVDMYGLEYYLYVEESYLDEFQKLAGGVADKYLTRSPYTYNQKTYIDRKDVDEWLSAESITVSAKKLSQYDWHYIYSYDGKAIDIECGMILQDYYTDELYLLNYSDYDRTYFYTDGTFDFNNEADVTVYPLENEQLKDLLVEFYDTEPEDDLDWLMGEGVNDTVALVFCAIVFGFVPLVTFVFALVMFFVVKDKKYRRPYAVIALGSLLVLVSCGVILLMLI